MKEIRWPMLTKKIVRRIGFTEASEKLALERETVQRIVQGAHCPGEDSKLRIRCLARDLKVPMK